MATQYEITQIGIFPFIFTVTHVQMRIDKNWNIDAIDGV